MTLLESVAAMADLGAISNTDVGNAERFAHANGTSVRYVPAADQWLVYDGKRWAWDGTCEVARRARQTAESILTELDTVPSAEARTALARHAIASLNDHKLRAMVRQAEAILGMAIRPDELDTDQWALNVDNGTIDLRTGALRPHDPRDLITRLVPIAYDPTARCPRFERFMREIMDQDAEMVRFLQRSVGYSLTGLTREQVLFLLWGLGANGKSTLFDILHALAGDYAARPDFTTFTQQRNDRPRNDLAKLDGMRLVSALEIGDGARLDESVVKSVTGGDMISARFLHKEFFEFRPRFKLWLAANHRPVIRETGHAMWRRVLLVPFTVTFAAEQRDERLLDELLTELPGILRWAIDGCLLWLEGGLQPPESVLAATAKYRAESDALGAFLDECCELRGETLSRDLYSAYQRWAEGNGDQPANGTVFGRRLTDRGIVATKRGGLKIRLGVSLKPAENRPSGQFNPATDGLTHDGHFDEMRARIGDKCVDSPNCPTVLNGHPPAAMSMDPIGSKIRAVVPA